MEKALGCVLDRRGAQYAQVCDSSESVGEDRQITERTRSSICKVVSFTALFLLGVAVGTLGGRLLPISVSGCHVGETSIHDDVIPQVRLFSLVTQSVRHYPEFETPPPAGGGTEPVWDSLIPNGVGYVIHPQASPNMSVVSVFHELHCLYLIRRAYYADDTENSKEKDFDVGIERHPHVGHCFDYLRQSILCAASSHLEPTTERANENPRWGFQRQCRNYTEIKEWAEQWRAFDIEGSFVPFSPAA